MRLFYIENEDFLVTLFEVLFKKSAHSIFTTKETQSLHLIEDQKPDIVMISLNYTLAEIADLVDQIRKITGYSTILVALGDKIQVASIKEKSWFDYYITKPFAPFEALAQLEKYLKRP
ncbi:MAG: hypothetical protein A2381_14415 [Bdellovibrionales bacterium RIFOXYB1_FULL_37_110]|nr:MAG: hypothetical protein A2417_07185 [Bdellovibrionales bacterium RIFOXYC1_FULL_37_79]OFZ57535.1 MAG: hypothetical protein A2381_14415 [Bdellovibrionales bacterium RIFOXYB1_FULL_37_110]OFZ63006.1 MAG: hypothetical protein A2577_07695 [Bdellovibrionales bacterium RIFOXYD1_FULL_36_51]